MRYWIETYGCQMNIAESNAVELLFRGSGFEKAARPEDADVAVVNTCSVRASAEDRVFGRLGIFVHIKQQRKQTLIFTGCMAERLKDSIKKICPAIDYVVPIREKMKIVELAKGNELLTDDGAFDFGEYHAVEGDFSAYIPIMNGCNNFCSYCIVPYVRGREVSRPVQPILDEVEKMDRAGVKEITLLGQNVNSFNSNGCNFPALLRKICSLELNNLRWIRFESPHPKDFSSELIDVIADEERVGKHLHIPIQCANDRILSLMNRRYNRERLEELFGSIRDKVRGVTFSTDVMVGFPSETDREFLETVDFMKKTGFIEAFMYYWNPREGTKAVGMDGQIPEKEKIARLERLISFQLANQAELKKKRLGLELDSLVTGVSRDDRSMYLARTSNCESAVFTPVTDVRPGDLIKLRLSELKGNTYVASVIT